MNNNNNNNNNNSNNNNKKGKNNSNEFQRAMKYQVGVLLVARTLDSWLIISLVMLSRRKC